MVVSIVSDERNEPITVEEAKTHLKIDLSNEDSYIAKLIRTARESVERYCNISITEKVIDVYYDKINSIITLPMPPLVSLDHFYYYDSIYTENEMNASIYKLININNLLESKIILKSGNTWSNYADKYGIKIQMTVGFNDESSLYIPEEILTEMLNLIAYWYENRESEGIMSEDVENKLFKYRLIPL